MQISYSVSINECNESRDILDTRQSISSVHLLIFRSNIINLANNIINKRQQCKWICCILLFDLAVYKLNKTIFELSVNSFDLFHSSPSCLKIKVKCAPSVLKSGKAVPSEGKIVQAVRMKQ